MTLEAIKRRIKSTRDLRSVVKTMKALAAVSIRQFEEAAGSLDEFNRAMEMALTALLMTRTEEIDRFAARGGDTGVVVFGSDQGMCGQFNDQILGLTEQRLREMQEEGRQLTIWACGIRIVSRLEDAGFALERVFELPGSVDGISPAVQELAIELQSWTRKRGLYEIHLMHNRTAKRAPFAPSTRRLLPPDPSWLERIAKKEWPTRQIPDHSGEWREMLSAVMRQYIFAGLFSAFAMSLAGENAARLTSMQAAERNIEEMLDKLVMDYNQERQTSITEELIDIISGFEAMTGGKV